MASIALGCIGGDRVAKRLCRVALSNPEDGARLCAIDALSYIDVSIEQVAEIVDTLVGIAENAKELAVNRGKALEALACPLTHIDKRTRRYKAALHLLLEMLKHEFPELRADAAYTLGSLNVQTALAQLKKMARTDRGRCYGNLTVAETARML